MAAAAAAAGTPTAANHNYGAASVPTFKPAPELGPDLDELRNKQSLWTRTALSWIGDLILTLAVIMPVWDSFRLVYDAAYVFFLGRFWPVCTIVLCVAVLLWYVLAMRIGFKYAWEGYKTEQTVLIIAMVATTALGLGLLMISVPLRREAADARHELFDNCQFGSRTQRLYEYSTVLHGIRDLPACRVKDSITECGGYGELLPYTGFLLNLEEKYHCSGFCWSPQVKKAAASAAQISGAQGISGAMVPGVQPDVAAPANGTLPMRTLPRVVPEASAPFRNTLADPEAMNEGTPSSLKDAIRQISVQPTVATSSSDSSASNVRGSSTRQAQSLLATGASFARQQALERLGPQVVLRQMNTSNSTRMPGRTYSYPPTLFSKANYGTSCDGVVARDLKFKAMAIGYSFYLQGAALLISTIIIGFLRVMMLCGAAKMIDYQQYPIRSEIVL